VAVNCTTQQCQSLTYKQLTSNQSYVTMYGQSVLVSSPHLGPKTRFLLLSDSCGFVDVGHPLWREDRSVIYNCCWPSPMQSFSSLSPTGLMTIFYCVRFETLPVWRTRILYLYPPGIEWPSYIPRHWVPFISLPMTRRATVQVFKSISMGGQWLTFPIGPHCIASAWTT
jgi:hypothetical protein